MGISAYQEADVGASHRRFARSFPSYMQEKVLFKRSVNDVCHDNFVLKFVFLIKLLFQANILFWNLKIIVFRA